MNANDQSRHQRVGRPVPSFLAAVLLLGAALGGVHASGAVRPHVATVYGQSGTTADGRQFIAALVHNTGHLAVRVEDVAFALDGWTDVDAVILAPGTEPSADGVASRTVGSAELAGSGSPDDGIWVMASGRPPCAGAPKDLIVHVRTWSRIERSVMVPDSTMLHDIPDCP